MHLVFRVTGFTEYRGGSELTPIIPNKSECQHKNTSWDSVVGYIITDDILKWALLGTSLNALPTELRAQWFTILLLDGWGNPAQVAELLSRKLNL